MSGGRWDYQNDHLCEELFRVYPDYGIATTPELFLDRRAARKADPFDDKLVSELVFDVFCLMHSLDWFKSGDTCEETYKEDLQVFREKWIRTIKKERVKELIDDSLAEVKEDLYKALLPAEGSNV